MSNSACSDCDVHVQVFLPANRLLLQLWIRWNAVPVAALLQRGGLTDTRMLLERLPVSAVLYLLCAIVFLF
ncbi:hypothetical protein BT96DRAFT_649785 [Gymnopus androsaceus JB14]|uniref:Uncharacterized protein n=1 Tax=Gymnopus androsaceus JB14 TaxID=1447944 RepID=A0A6A4HUI3_9AGAR|nr:hypothetical protein BT96DRAFT_649785 [Gymnopus androsaceus JB14]